MITSIWILWLILFFVAYSLDYITCLALRKKKPNLFNKVEANQQVKNLLTKYSPSTSYVIFLFTFEIQYLIMYCITSFFMYRILFGEWSLLFSVLIGLVFLSLFHLVAMLSNIITLIFKKEVQNGTTNTTITTEPK